MNILDTLARQSTVETKRRRRADELLSDSALSITFKDSASVAALVNGHHSCAIIAQADGEVVGLLFDGAVAVDKGESDAALFAEPKSQRNRGGTSFTWLTEAWRRWSHHQVLILTDGCGEMPNVLLHDRERTTAIVIPDSDPDAMTTICARVVELDDLSRLPSLMAMLVPRTTTA